MCNLSCLDQHFLLQSLSTIFKLLVNDSSILILMLCIEPISSFSATMFWFCLYIFLNYQVQFVHICCLIPFFCFFFSIKIHIFVFVLFRSYSMSFVYSVFVLYLSYSRAGFLYFDFRYLIVLQVHWCLFFCSIVTYSNVFVNFLFLFQHFLAHSSFRSSFVSNLSEIYATSQHIDTYCGLQESISESAEGLTLTF